MNSGRQRFEKSRKRPRWFSVAGALGVPGASIALLLALAQARQPLAPGTIAAAGCLSLLLGGAHLLNARKALNERDALREEVVALRRDFERQILGRTSELMEENRAEQKAFAKTVGDLERQLTERTVQVEAANKELEAFAYSVSHDLRAPLERIAAFAGALEEDCGPELDEQGKDYVKRIRDGAERMGRLIDAILTLSRTTRGELRREVVDLSRLARDIERELVNSHPGREVTLVVHPGLVTRGDPELLKAALVNLLGNAWKFTGRCNEARVEFGCSAPSQAEPEGQRGKTVYFVRDNGVGFDMAYVDKLFTAFQRLHREADFPGTGIGLATVRRIVHRHGGEVWASGDVDRGATFYFTLGPPVWAPERPSTGNPPRRERNGA